MATSRYEETLRRVQSLSPAEQKQLLHEIAEQLDAPSGETASILQLQGLGKEVWCDFDAQEYINRETRRVEWIDSLRGGRQLN